MDEDVVTPWVFNLLVILLAIGPLTAQAQDRTSAKESSSRSVLDFEADVIRGEKRQPTIFLEFESHSPTMDSIIFKRRNFNDFHAVDRRGRLLYQPDRALRSEE